MIGVSHVDVLAPGARTRGRVPWGRLRRAVITGVAAAATTGIVSAIVTRMLMRATAFLLREPTSFSLAGSAGIALIYTVALLPGCIALASTRRRWAWAVLAAGCALLLFSAVNIGYAETAAAHDLTPLRIAGLTLVLSAMVGVYALQMYAAARWATRLPLSESWRYQSIPRSSR